MAVPAPDFAPLDALLRGVSRSFYVSIRLLPAGLRAPVGTAYLLARATDTVADCATAGRQQREDILARLGDAIGQGSLPLEVAGEVGALAPGITSVDERQLLQRLPECFRLLSSLAAEDRADVQTVLAHIVGGQRLDLERFPGALPDAAALHEYAYLVAGCVGEFWTDLCVRHVPGYSDRPPWQMRTLGRSLGIGLQLVNILRDAGEDRAAGRTYLPADQIADSSFEAVWRRWQDEALERLQDGMTYAQAVNPRRIRAAVALPALLGQRTLALLRTTGPRALQERVKVPRREVYALLARLAFGLASRGSLRREWDNRAR